MAQRERHPVALWCASTHAALAMLVMGMALSAAAAASTCGLTLFADQESVGGNTFETDTLEAPSGLTATEGAVIDLQWTATPDAYASGYRIYRSDASGGPYTLVAEVTPRTATSYTDTPPAGTYFYVVRAFYEDWESVDSEEVTATVT